MSRAGDCMIPISQSSVVNRILTKVPNDEFERLAPHLTLVPLRRGQILYTAEDRLDFVYFPNWGMVAMVSYTESGDSLEVGLVGNEGMVGIPAILGIDITAHQVQVQLAGSALKVHSTAVREAFEHCDILRTLLLRYTYILMIQLSQGALCNHFHSIEARLAKWLLFARDNMRSNDFKITQESFSQMMGSHRPNINVAARVLQDAGLIHYNRGYITILDAARLESVACHCYSTVQGALETFYKVL